MSTLGLYILLVFGIVGVPAPHGSTYCYSCQNVKDPDTCHIVQQCHHGQSCGAETRYHNGHYQLDLRCFDHHECDHSVNQVGEVIVGRRDTHPLQCRKCCHGNRCNKHLCGIQHATNTTKGSTCRNHEEDGITCASLANLNLCKATDGTASYLAHNKCPLYCGTCTSGGTDTVTTNAVSYTKCFSCENVRDLSQCTREVTCHHEQFCGTWAGVDHEGRMSYWLGCYERPECEHRDEHNHNECTECCASTHCNNRDKCASFIAAHDPNYHTTQPTTKAPVQTAATTKAPTVATLAPTVAHIHTAATTRAPTVVTHAPTVAHTHTAATTRAPTVATHVHTDANTHTATTSRAPTVATHAHTHAHPYTAATTRAATGATHAPTAAHTHTAATTHAPIVTTRAQTDAHTKTATTTRVITDIPHTTGDKPSPAHVTATSQAGTTAAPIVVASTTVVQASSTRATSQAGTTAAPIVVASTTVVQASSTRAPGACYDDEKNGFSCSSLDAFNFCTDTSSFAHPLAVERCPKHCRFCT